MIGFIVMLTVAAPISAIGGGVLSPAGPVGRAENLILYDALAIMLAIVIPTLLAAGLFAWWFRASNRNARYLRDFAYSGRIELIVWSIPTLVILFLGGVILIGSHRLDPATPLPTTGRPLEVQVVSLDWKWLFIYPEQKVATINELVVPAGVPVHFSLTSASVMNVFFVPQLGSMIYTMNRTVTQLHLQADQPGEFLGESAQFSGDGFSDMRFTLRAVPEQQFASWLGTVRQAGGVLDRATYIVLSRPSMNAPPSTFGSVEDGLFQAVVTQQIPPGPGPANAPATAAAPVTATAPVTANVAR
jgi:cytochrome o ubiquinol oxidase subunit II